MKLGQELPSQPAADYRYQAGKFMVLNEELPSEDWLKREGWLVSTELGSSTFCFRIYNKGNSWIVIDLIHDHERCSVIMDGLPDFYSYLRDYVRPVLNLHVEAKALERGSNG